jgi:two-component sensor histidine kinase
LAEKEVLLREVHHRVKNNLQVISSLVSLQAANLVDERTREVFGDVRDRVRTMALVHEKLYQSGNLAQLNFADYVTSLLHYLWRAHGTLADKVQLKLELAPWCCRSRPRSPAD